jgi:AraC-like DNA-binding protein
MPSKRKGFNSTVNELKSEPKKISEQKDKLPLVGWTFRPTRMGSLFRQKFSEVSWYAIPKEGQRGQILESELRGATTKLSVLWLPFPEVQEYASRGLLRQVDDVLSSTELKARFSPAVGLCRFEKKLYAVPAGISPQALFVRKDIWEKAKLPLPKTWTQFASGLKILRDKGVPSPFGLYGSEHTARHFIWSILGSNGIACSANLMDLDRMHGALVEAFDWAKLLEKELGWTKCFRGGYGWKQLFQREMEEGDCACAWAPYAGSADLIYETGKKLVLLPFPQGPSGTKMFVPLGGGGWTIPHNTRDPQRSVTMIRSIESVSWNHEIHSSGYNYYFPALTTLWKNKKMQDQDPLLRWSSVLMKIDGAFVLNSLANSVADSFFKALVSGLKAEQWIHEVHAALSRESTKQAQNPIVKKAMDHVEKNLEHISGAENLADQLGISLGYLTRLMMQEIKLNCADYLRKVRMEKAKVLLRNEKFSIKEIAASVGLPNPESFSHIFRQYYGRSPQAFRDERSS